MFNITRFALDNNRLTLALLAVIIIFGMQTYQNMPRAYDPGFTIRTAQIITYFPGASPKRVEELVSSKIEDVAKEIPELDYVKSESRTGVSIVNVNIKESYKNMRPIWDNLRRKVEDVNSELPDGTIGPIVNDEFGDVYGIVFAITGEGFDYKELKSIADSVKRELQRLPDVAKVAVYGERDERIYIDYNNARLSELGISPSQLAQILSARNIVMSGGSIVIGDERIELEPSGSYETVSDIEHTIIQTPNTDKLFYLKDIASVYSGYQEPPSTVIRASGKEGLVVAISMREGGNNIQLGKDVNRVIDRLQSEYPYGIDFEAVNFSPAEVDAKVKDFANSLLQAVLVVTIVMLFSLGLRTGLVVATLIPASMLFALIVMSFFEIGLDQISLAALIIALGMLVDNGIVMSENIMMQMESGKRPYNAAIDSATELRIPLLTASLTTAAAFLPIFLAESNVGEFTASLFKVVSITLLCSWLLSLTVIPLLCTLFMKVKKKELNLNSTFYSKYKSLLLVLLKFRLTSLLVVLIVFIVVMSGFAYIPKIFFPPSDRAYFKMELEMPLGTDIEATRSVVEKVDSYIMDNLLVNDERTEGVTNWASYIGSGGPRFILSHNPKPASSNYSIFNVNVTSAELIDPMMRELDQFTFDNLPDTDVTIRKIENGPAIAYPVEVRLSGENTEKLFEIVGALKEKMTQIDGTKNISDDWGQRIKKLNINIKQSNALRVGISSQDIAVSLQTGLSGLQLTEYRQGEDIIPVMLRSEASSSHDIGKIESLAIYSQSTGKSVLLRQVADVEVVWEAAKILRRGGLKTVSVRAQLESGYTAAQIFGKVESWLEQQSSSWGIGYTYEYGGEAETSGKSNKSIADKLPVAVFIILILLVAQFNSIRKPVIILTTIPLGLIGVVIGLLVADSFFGFMTLLGIISLAGIVINNAIVLLERIKIEIDELGLSPQDAIISASQKRMRPILLTTATTVLGLLPLYLGGGEMWEPMAVAIMAGLLFSTILTLGIIPVLYSLLYQIKY